MKSWTVEVTKVETIGGNVVVTVVFKSSDGELIKEFLRGDTVTKDYVEEWAWTRLESLRVRDASRATIQVGPITPRKPKLAIPPAV